ncbi:uncharacterized protein Z519_01174 [Cladophialophora bantiana CBS 173.52]|uniref:Glucose-methanol-choline oxidoreductase C-terminal domain-containing protein n=1 Tax=Cladophialophora bantiana (strain ATCC 10958 / CBS 173.52 / CDC B-1940 / NIH 8579) TaxID=1442370 RepID=A0A0D2I332_CLAB1|nr:uncharacterized protein Z519_01174 [Cladophialophora bantiana CBS 173.52]KIW97590.1 hypothetical protein Z519_01174 [Cladophialophora bantiana CBS 173.52]
MPFDALVTENGVVAQKLLKQNTDTSKTYDVIVIGSGMGGGVLASALADKGKKVLVLEAGSLLFHTHVGNIPRRFAIGKFQKHIWSLWETFKVINYNQAGSNYKGAQAFNLGGRSIFWGSSIPELASWELASPWPAVVKDYLLTPGLDGKTGYEKARRVFNADDPGPTAFQTEAKAILDRVVTGWHSSNAPVAVEYVGATNWSVPAGIFSTADLLLEDVLVETPATRHVVTVNLNHAVWNVERDPANSRKVTGVKCYDLLANQERTYKAKQVVICAGTIESTKIALKSNLPDPNHKIGKGITDHAILYRHFVIPKSFWPPTSPSPFSGPLSEPRSAKVLLTHPGATETQYAFDIIVELGAQFNQGRYVDPDHLAADTTLSNGGLLCEIVFQFYAPLNDNNKVERDSADPENPAKRVNVTIHAATVPDPLLIEAKKIAKDVLTEFQAVKVEGEQDLYDSHGNVILETASIGGVAHEVGTLRMSSDGSGVVDENLKFHECDNLYACDNSVFPASPAGNPSLTLCALALRLADRLGS